MEAYNKYIAQYMGGVADATCFVSPQEPQIVQALADPLCRFVPRDSWILQRAVTEDNGKLYKFTLAVVFCLMKGFPIAILSL